MHTQTQPPAFTCGTAGLYYGAQALVAKGADGVFRPCLPILLKRALAGKAGGMQAVAAPLSRGDVACAMIATLHMGLPELTQIIVPMILCALCWESPIAKMSLSVTLTSMTRLIVDFLQQMAIGFKVGIEQKPTSHFKLIFFEGPVNKEVLDR